MTRVPAALLAVSLAACGAEPAVPPHVHATVTRRADTISFEAPAVVYRCENAPDLLFQGVRYGHGVLVWLRLRDSLVREFPIIGVRDTITRPGAVVAVRYSHEAVGHTLSLDSGKVMLSDSTSARQLVITGSGLDLDLGARSAVAATFAELPEAPDSTTSCVRPP